MFRLLLPLALGTLAFFGVRALREESPERLSARSAGELLLLPVGEAPAPGGPDARAPLWRTLLERVATRGADGRTTLALGRVSVDPTVARLAALEAGELLRLKVGSEPASGAEDTREELWKLVLDGPAAERTDEGLVLRLYGCRHTADVAAAPVIEDTWFARLALAEAFREIAGEHPEVGRLVIEGDQVPVKGGANFELQLLGDRHGVQFTVDDSDAEPLLAGRRWRPVPPNDALARAELVQGLLANARNDPDYAALEIDGVEQPAEGGLDLRLESLGGIQTLACSGAGIEPVRVKRSWTPPGRDQRFPLLAGGAVLFGSFLLVRATRRERAPAAPPPIAEPLRPVA